MSRRKQAKPRALKYGEEDPSSVEVVEEDRLSNDLHKNDSNDESSDESICESETELSDQDDDIADDDDDDDEDNDDIDDYDHDDKEYEEDIYSSHTSSSFSPSLSDGSQTPNSLLQESENNRINNNNNNNVTINYNNNNNNVLTRPLSRCKDLNGNSASKKLKIIIDSNNSSNNNNVPTVAVGEIQKSSNGNANNVNGDGTYNCQFCDKIFPRLGYLKKHEQSHAEHMPFKCDYCARLFKHKRSRDRHTKLHTGDRRYRCPHCEAAFSRSDHLKIHMKTHDNQKPFQCTICNRGYNTAAALTSHMQNHKKQSNPLINKSNIGISTLNINYLSPRSSASPNNSTNSLNKRKYISVEDHRASNIINGINNNNMNNDHNDHNDNNNNDKNNNDIGKTNNSNIDIKINVDKSNKRGTPLLNDSVNDKKCSRIGNENVTNDNNGNNTNTNSNTSPLFCNYCTKYDFSSLEQLHLHIDEMHSTIGKEPQSMVLNQQHQRILHQTAQQQPHHHHHHQHQQPNHHHTQTMNQSFQLTCEFCTMKFSNIQIMFHHVRTTHVDQFTNIRAFNSYLEHLNRFVNGLPPVTGIPANINNIESKIKQTNLYNDNNNKIDDLFTDNDNSPHDNDNSIIIKLEKLNPIVDDKLKFKANNNEIEILTGDDRQELIHRNNSDHNHKISEEQNVPTDLSNKKLEETSVLKNPKESEQIPVEMMNSQRHDNLQINHNHNSNYNPYNNNSQHHHIGSFLCNQCNAAMPDFESFRLHLRQHLNQRYNNNHHHQPQQHSPQYHFNAKTLSNFTCPNCGMHFRLKNDYEHHIISHFLITQSEFYCNFKNCSNKTYPKSDDLQKHLLDVHTKNVFKCGICMEIFDKRVEIQVHFARNHSNELKLFRCSACTEQFKSDKDFNHHIKIKHLPAIDNVQSQSQTMVAELPPSTIAPYTPTTMIHTSESEQNYRNSAPAGKPQFIQCQFCPAKCTTDLEMHLHSATHTRQYRCPSCPETFHVEFLLDRHIQQQHNDAATAATSAAPVTTDYEMQERNSLQLYHGRSLNSIEQPIITPTASSSPSSPSSRVKNTISNNLFDYVGQTFFNPLRIETNHQLQTTAAATPIPIQTTSSPPSSIPAASSLSSAAAFLLMKNQKPSNLHQLYNRYTEFSAKHLYYPIIHIPNSTNTTTNIPISTFTTTTSTTESPAIAAGSTSITTLTKFSLNASNSDHNQQQQLLPIQSPSPTQSFTTTSPSSLQKTGSGNQLSSLVVTTKTNSSMITEMDHHHNSNHESLKDLRKSTRNGQNEHNKSHGETAISNDRQKTDFNVDGFKCGICERNDFNSESDVQTHRKIFHNIKTGVSLHCAYCNGNFRSRNELENHMKITHSTSGKHKCLICDEVYPSSALLAEHKLGHLKSITGTPSKCFHCGKPLMDVNQFKLHMSEHSCNPGCLQNNSNNRDAVNNTITGGGGTIELPQQCICCRQTLNSEFEILLHAKFHTQPSTGLTGNNCCALCLEIMPNNVVTKICEKCFKKHNFPGIFSNYVKSFSKNNNNNNIFLNQYSQIPFILKYQQHLSSLKQLPTKQILNEPTTMLHEQQQQQQHRITRHPQEQQFSYHHHHHHQQIQEIKCQLCKKSLGSLEKLQEHLIEHSFHECKDRGYICYICSSVFTVPSGLKSHMIDDHGLKARPYDCNICDGKFFFRAELENHLIEHKLDLIPINYNDVNNGNDRANDLSREPNAINDINPSNNKEIIYNRNESPIESVNQSIIIGQPTILNDNDMIVAADYVERGEPEEREDQEAEQEQEQKEEDDEYIEVENTQDTLLLDHTAENHRKNSAINDEISNCND